MNAWQQLLATYPLLQTIQDGLITIVPLACLLAYCGIYFLSSTARIIAVSRRRAPYEKCSRQIALLGLFLGWGLLIGARIWLYLTRTEHIDGSMESFMLEMSWLLLSIGVLFSTIYYCCWRILKNMPVLHSTLGVISAVQNCIALVCILFTIKVLAVAPAPVSQHLALPMLFPDAWEAALWSAACYTTPLIFALAGGFCSFWLVLRRKRDDFGRDYYKLMIPWCAAWARNGWTVVWLLLLISTALEIWPRPGAPAFEATWAALAAARLLIWFIPLPLWNLVKKSPVPLRHSWAALLALLFASAFMLPYFVEITIM